MPAPRCLRCDNTGQVIEWRLVWQRRPEGVLEGLPQRCFRRVASREEGLERMARLEESDLDAQVVSCSLVCQCRKRVEPKSPVDWKMAQAGKREEMDAAV